MKEEALQQFVDLHKNEKLVSPEEPGTVYANLAEGLVRRFEQEILRF